MIYYKTVKTDDNRSKLLFGALCIHGIYTAIKQQILNAEIYTTEMLQTSEGITLMKNIFVGIWLIQVILAVILLLVRFISGISIIKLPAEVHSNYQLAAYFVIPPLIPTGIQFILYKMSLGTPQLLLILIGIASVFLIQWERSRSL